MIFFGLISPIRIMRTLPEERLKFFPTSDYIPSAGELVIVACPAAGK